MDDEDNRSSSATDGRRQIERDDDGKQLARSLATRTVRPSSSSSSSGSPVVL